MHDAVRTGGRTYVAEGALGQREVWQVRDVSAQVSDHVLVQFAPPRAYYSIHVPHRKLLEMPHVRVVLRVPASRHEQLALAVVHVGLHQLPDREGAWRERVVVGAREREVREVGRLDTDEPGVREHRLVDQLHVRPHALAPLEVPDGVGDQIACVSKTKPTRLRVGNELSRPFATFADLPPHDGTRYGARLWGLSIVQGHFLSPRAPNPARSIRNFFIACTTATLNNPRRC
jgi:hypothetical protein